MSTSPHVLHSLTNVRILGMTWLGYSVQCRLSQCLCPSGIGYATMHTYRPVGLGSINGRAAVRTRALPSAMNGLASGFQEPASSSASVLGDYIQTSKYTIAPCDEVLAIVYMQSRKARSTRATHKHQSHRSHTGTLVVLGAFGASQSDADAL